MHSPDPVRAEFAFPAGIRPEVRGRLAQVVLEHGRLVANDRKRCEGLLRDYCGDECRSTIKMLLLAVDEQVHTKLLAADGHPLGAVVGRMVGHLEHDLGMHRDAAQWVVESWAIALGLPMGDWAQTTRHIPQALLPTESASATPTISQQPTGGSPFQPAAPLPDFQPATPTPAVPATAPAPAVPPTPSPIAPWTASTPVVPSAATTIDASASTTFVPSVSTTAVPWTATTPAIQSTATVQAIQPVADPQPAATIPAVQPPPPPPTPPPIIVGVQNRLPWSSYVRANILRWTLIVIAVFGVIRLVLDVTTLFEVLR